MPGALVIKPMLDTDKRHPTLLPLKIVLGICMADTYKCLLKSSTSQTSAHKLSEFSSYLM